MNLAEPLQMALPTEARIEPVGPARAPALMSVEAFRALLELQPQLKRVRLEGAGEPLAHPRLFEMIGYAASRGIEVTTSSSLLTISDARIEECVKSGLRRLDVVPACADPADFDYLRAGARLQRALLNVRRLAAARPALGATLPEIRVVLMVTRSSLPRLAELVRSVAAHGADALALRHLWHDAVAARRFVEAESLLAETPDFSEAQAVAAGLNIALSLPDARLAGSCDRPWRALHLGASGEALPCAMAKTAQRLSFGSTRREGVVRIWNSDAFREFRERVGTETPPALCRQCTRQL